MTDPAAKPAIDWPRLVPLAILTVSLGALAAAYTAQYVYGLEPCALCLYQRIPYAIAGVMGLLALLMRRERKDGAMLLLVIVAATAFFAGGGIAFFHIGVEQHWWQSLASCGGDPWQGPKNTDQLRQMLLAEKPVKACDEVEWTLFGLSMATYNLPVSLGLAAASLWGLTKIRSS